MEMKWFVLAPVAVFVIVMLVCAVIQNRKAKKELFNLLNNYCRSDEESDFNDED